MCGHCAEGERWHHSKEPGWSYFSILSIRTSQASPPSPSPSSSRAQGQLVPQVQGRLPTNPEIHGERLWTKQQHQTECYKNL